MDFTNFSKTFLNLADLIKYNKYQISMVTVLP